MKLNNLKITAHTGIKDGNNGYFDFITVNTDISCKVSMKSESKRSYQEYMDSSMSSISFTNGYSIEAVASVFGVTLGASRTNTKKQDSEEQEIYKVPTHIINIFCHVSISVCKWVFPNILLHFQLFLEEKGEVVIATANCFTFDLAIGSFARPKFSANFISALKRLDDALYLSEEKQIETYKTFLQEFGTHYVRKAQFGASLNYQVLAS